MHSSPILGVEKQSRLSLFLPSNLKDIMYRPNIDTHLGLKV